MDQGLVYVGKIIEINPIEKADFIVSATVICGKGGIWKGIVRKEDFSLGQECVVYLPDSIIPEHAAMKFMAAYEWRVKMRRFKGAPSEVVIMPLKHDFPVGTDMTMLLGVKKYEKPISPNLQGRILGHFPSFIPKTDELNYQKYPELVESLHGKPYYITEKADGSSSTAYKYKGHFGVCSRNYELVSDANNGFWQIVEKYELEENLPEGIAIQWETCGPKIQSNPMGLKEISGFAFSAYDIDKKMYLPMQEFDDLCDQLSMPTVKFIDIGYSFDKKSVSELGDGKYANGNEREGVVVRSQQNFSDGKPISFKVINLNYET